MKPEDPEQASPPETNGADEGADASAEAADPADPAEEIEGLKKALALQHDAHLRAVAEAENIRRRSQREVSAAYGRGQRQIVRELLTAIDSLELGLSALDAASAEDLAEGQRATLRQFLKALEQFGVEAVEPEGQPFDPERHEAVGLQPSDSVPADSVIAVMQKGYLMQGRLLRAARVVVCSGPPAQNADADAAD